MVTNKIDFEGHTIANGRYEILGLLGEGNMGLVYKALDNNLDAEVVIKVPTEESLRDEEFVERFKIEIRSMVKLSHPHVVSIIDTGHHSEDGELVPYVVMQYLSGGCLKDRMLGADGRRKPMPASSLGDWLLEVAKALDFMHAEKYIHRDVKPANILFDKHGNPFLSDFGLAKVLSVHEEDRESNSLTAAGFLVGTPNYVAPELVMGQTASAGVDQYSLAMTVYEVLTGVCPMEGPTASATMVNQTNREARPPHTVVSGIPLPLSKAILKGLAKKPGDRFGSCVELAETMLRAARGGAGAEAAPAGDRRTARRDPKRTSGQPGADDWDEEYEVAAAPKLPPKVGAGKGSSKTRGRAKKTKGERGRVKCPSCSRVLPLKDEHAGRRGKCIHCQARLEIGTDLRTLTLLTTSSGRQVSPGAARSGDTSRGGSSATSRHSVGDDLVIGEKLFGLDLSRRAALFIFFALIVVVVATSIFIGIYSQRDIDKERADDLLRDRTSTESGD